MSVVEKAEVGVVEGRVDEFETLLPKALQILRSAAGCNSVTASKGVEHPDMFMLLVEWDSVEAHIACTQTSEFAEFAGLLGPFFNGPPQTVHYVQLGL